MSSLERRLDKLEARQPGAALMPKLVITFVCPERGITGARWLDGSTIERAEEETEPEFRQRMEARSAIVFADPKYVGPAVKLSGDDLRL
jgi:hypothetical protein